MNLKRAIRKVFLGEILAGMALTLRKMFTHAVTRQYPKDKREPFKGFRGMHAFVRDPKTGREKCIVCLKCATICPSQCIYIGYRQDGKRVLENYEIDSLKCVYCGYCVEVCPVNALVLTEEYEYSGYTREELLFTREKLLQNWDTFTAKLDSDTYFNKFWKPPGIDPKKMAAGKRSQAPVPIKGLLSEKPAPEKTEAPQEEERPQAVAPR